MSENRRFTITGPEKEFPQVSRIASFRIVADILDYSKPPAGWVPKLLASTYRDDRMAVRAILNRFNSEGDECFPHTPLPQEMTCF